YVDKASNGSWTYATIAIHNAGGFRSSIEETNYNEITFNDLVTCTPFLNTIDTLELQGRDLLQVLEKSVSNPFNSTASGGFNGKGFLQYAASLAAWSNALLSQYSRLLMTGRLRSKSRLGALSFNGFPLFLHANVEPTPCSLASLSQSGRVFECHAHWWTLVTSCLPTNSPRRDVTGHPNYRDL
ncbi:unnamed protein product, partial [Timema podura]|nr:unnamed protein product [Timema podura]